MKKGIDFIGASVGAMIFNHQGKLFLTKRGQKAKNERGFWENPGGAIELGETLEEAVRREIKEEHSIAIRLIEQFPASDHFVEGQHWVATTFLAQIKKGQEPVILEPEKCEAIGWFDMGKLPKPISVITKLDLKYFYKHKDRLTEKLI